MATCRGRLSGPLVSEAVAGARDIHHQADVLLSGRYALKLLGRHLPLSDVGTEEILHTRRLPWGSWSARWQRRGLAR